MSKVRSRRVATVVLAPLVALAAWGLFRTVGVAFHVSTGSGRVGARDVVFGATVAALVGCLVVRWLEGHVRRPRVWWARVGSTCFAASLAGPSWLADGGSAVALMALHLVTAVVIVAGFASTMRWQMQDAPARPARVG
jgi:hypothetical protein